MNNNSLDITSLENWLWEAACKIRGEIDAPKYKDYILPLIFLKRLSDVFDDEISRLTDDYGSEEIARQLAAQDHSLVRFYIPEAALWSKISLQPKGIGEYLTDAIRAVSKENQKLQGVFETIDFNATAGGQRLISEDRLKSLIDVLDRHRLGLTDVEPDIIGRAYEYLLRKFAEGSGQSAGEFYTPREVAVLMAHILDPRPGDHIYDPTCGSGGLLIKSHLRFREKYDNESPVEPLRFYGQEINHTTYAMAKMNTFLHDMEADIVLGDTMSRPAFLNKDGSMNTFDKVTANPMWNQDFDQSTYENDGYDRFNSVFPPSSSADWGWIQHMFASLKDNGKMAVVLDTGAVSRGSGNQGANRERDIRKIFVEEDLVEAVILLPDNLFYNTTAPGIILVVNKDKRVAGEILLINGSKLFSKGRPKNYLPDDSIEKIYELYSDWKEEEGLSKVITGDVAAKNDYNLSPSRYVSDDGKEEVLPIEEAVVLLKEAEEERNEADERLREILVEMGIEV